MKTVATRLGALVCLALAFAQTASAELIYGIAAVGNSPALVTWDSAAPGALLSGSFLSGLQPNESILGIDFRPAGGSLYGVTSQNRLVTISPFGNVAHVAGTTVLPGFSFGMGFNPTIDRIRMVAETNTNNVINPANGATTPGTNVFYGPADPNFGVDPNVVHSAYTNDFFGAATTQLYGIDSGLDLLVTQANSAGTLGTVGPLGVDIGALGGFDISGATGVAYAALLPANTSVSQFYRIDLLTGAATNLGQIDGGLVITAMAVTPGVIPEPATIALLGLGLVGCVLARRKTA